MKIVEAGGIIRPQGVTIYQYGTHILVDGEGNTLYALHSEQVELDKHTKQYVTVFGSLVPGYPVDNGPEYLEVTEVVRGVLSDPDGPFTKKPQDYI